MEIEELNDFTKYPKLFSPFIKDDKFRNTEELIYTLPKGDWVVTEKIDGTNIRIIITKPNDNGEREVLIGTRKLILNTEDKSSQQFMGCLEEVNLYKLKEYFKDIDSTVVIYGEGYGEGVQTGAIYSSKKNYRVFDIRIGNAYQDWKYVEKVCLDNQLNIVPVLAIVDQIDYNSCQKILNENQETLIKGGLGGKCEGYIFKIEPVLLNKYGERLIFKAKFRDFKIEK